MMTKIHKTLTATIAAVFLSSFSVAAVAPITAATYSSSVAGTLTDPVSFTSITVGGQVYTNLEYGTPSFTEGFATEYYYTDGEDPASQTATLSTNILTDGVLNIPGGLVINFGREITAQDLIFVTELTTGGNGEALAMGLTDSSNGIISGTAVHFGNTGAGAGDLLDMDVIRTSNDSTIDANLRGSGVFLSDFNSPGATAPHGIYFSFSSEGELDPSVVGLATVPEPTSLALTLLFAGLFVVGVRRRS